MPKRNVTIVLDEELIVRLRQLPQVRESSLSTYVAELLEREDQKQSIDALATLRKSFECFEAAKVEISPWKWNREEIYDRFDNSILGKEMVDRKHNEKTG
jgi:hypothetical protein